MRAKSAAAGTPLRREEGVKQLCQGGAVHAHAVVAVVKFQHIAHRPGGQLDLARLAFGKAVHQ
ncbi:hypothetical protein D3C71_713770 [compost metagenome]